MISARIPVEVLAKLDEWAANNECTRSTAVAELLAKALAAKPGRKRKADKAGNVI
jgi:metal-responsive CopG/Arc/MetJ family transcriptional regulator